MAIDSATRRFLLTLRKGWSLRVAVGAVLAASVLGAVAIWGAGADLKTAGMALIRGSVGSGVSLANSAAQITPILLTGLGIVIAFRAGLFNIGAEGQLIAGATAAAPIGLYATWFPGPVRLVCMVVAAAIGGAVWGLIPGALRAYLGLNEIITSLFLNFVAFYGVSYLVSGPMKDSSPASAGYPWSAPLPAGTTLPNIPVGSGLTSGLVMALAFAAAVAILLNWHQLGLDWRSLGGGGRAALFSGVPVKRRILQAMAVSGALAGLAGLVELAGIQFRLSDSFSQGYGFDGIVVAVAGGLNAQGAVVAAMFFGALRAGSASMQRIADVPSAIAQLVEGLTVAFIIVAYGTRLVRRRLRGVATEA